MTTITIALDALLPDPFNARRTSPRDESINLLAASIHTLGLLHPIVVRATPASENGYYVTAGARRVAACRSLGWHSISATIISADNEDEIAPAVSAAENMVRRTMHPVDQWRAVATLIDQGFPINAAADALGLDLRFARRLEWLGRLAPPILDRLSREDDLPETQTLRIMAMAPLDVQIEAFQQVAGRRNGENEEIDWWAVAAQCRCERIPLSRSIFDTETAAVRFDENLFAEPGSDNQFTTADVQGFLAAQRQALQAKAEKSKGRIIVARTDKRGELVPPTGYALAWDQIPKRWRKDDTRKHAMAVSGEGYHLGGIVERVVIPIAKPAAPDPLSDTGQEMSDAASDIPAPQREPITKAVQTSLAILKGEATAKAARAVIPEWAEADNWPDIVRLLLFCFTADNVSTTRGAIDPRQLAGRLLHPEGDIKALTIAEIAEVVADVVAGIVAFDHPNTNFGTSGPAAEWIASMVDAAQCMPRCDTEEILRGFKGEALLEIARAHGIATTGKRAEVLQRMVGRMPDWRPVEFGAPGVDVSDMTYDDETDPSDDEAPIQEAAE
jgi:ParB/RepB/Spo0J family partition protein